MSAEGKRGDSYLSLDGAFSGLPALFIIKEIFDRLAYDLDIDHELKPCEVFNMIVGTGKGGLDAILFGRLKMTPSEAIAAYSKLSNSLPTQPADSEEIIELNDYQFNSTFTEVLESLGLSAEEPLRDSHSSCATVLLTTNAANTAICEPLQTHRSRKYRTSPCTILEAAKAVVSSPGFFSPVKIGEKHNLRLLLDATINRPNPIKELLRQAEDYFGKEKEVAVIVSLGVVDSKLLPPDVDERKDTYPAKQALMHVAQDDMREHREIYRRLKNFGVYFRFSIDCGLMANVEKMSEVIQVKSKEYFEQEEVSDLIDEVAQALRVREPKITLKKINSIEVVPTILRTPPSLVRHFVGRHDVLLAMYSTHFDQGLERRSGPILTLLTGLGGVGKTQISVKFLDEYRKQFLNHSIYFVDARSKEQLEGDLQSIIRSLGEGYQSMTHVDALAWLSGVHKEWLIIYDNADDPSLQLHRYIPKSNLGHAIISSRNYNLRELCPQSHHHVGGLPSDDAIELLLNLSHSARTEANEQLASDIVSTLGFLPLAIAHAASYIYRHDCLDDFLAMYRKHTKKLLAQLPKGLPEDYSLSVAATIEMSFERLSSEAKDLLTLLAFFHVTGVARDIFAVGAGRGFEYVNFPLRSSKPVEIAVLAEKLKKVFCPSGTWSDYEFNELVEECRHYSLLSEARDTEGGRFYSMHLLVHTRLQERQEREQKADYYRQVARLLSSYMPKESTDRRQSRNRALQRHARFIPLDTPLLPEDDYHLALTIGNWGDYLTAKTRGERVLDEIRSCDKVDMVQMSKVLRVISVCECALGQYQQASERAKAALEIQTTVLGDEHEEVMMTTGILANSIHRLGVYEEAFQLRKLLLAKLDNILGKEHYGTQAAMRSMAESFTALGRYQEAFDLQTRLLEVQKQAHGKEHPETIVTMESLACTVALQGQISDALNIRSNVVELRKKVFGEDDIDTLTSMLNQTTSLMDLGRFEEALEIQTRILGVQKRELGDAHPNTLTTMVTIQTTLVGLGHHEEAIRICEEMVEKQKQLYGPDDMTTLLAVGLLAGSLVAVGRFEESLELQIENAEKIRKIVGEDNPQTLAAMQTVANTLALICDRQEVVDQQERVTNLTQKRSNETISKQCLLWRDFFLP